MDNKIQQETCVKFDQISSSSSEQIAQDSWNTRFQNAIDLETEHWFDELDRVYSDFVDTSRFYGQLIIREYSVLPEHRIVKKFDCKEKSTFSVAVRGISFTLCDDPKIDKEKCVYMYGHSREMIEFAAKAKGHQLKATINALHAMIPLGKNQQNKVLTCPMMCLVDWGGLRLTATPAFLPIGRNTLVYGSTTDGDTVRCDSEFSDLLSLFASRLHIAQHLVKGKMLWTAGDVQGHVGSDNRYYLLNMGRIFAPEDPAVANHLQKVGNPILYRLLRPELLGLWKLQDMPPLSGDSWSKWEDKQDAEKHNTNNTRISKYMIQECIPALAALFDEKPHLLEEPISPQLHQHGINVRHLGRLRSLVQTEPGKHILLLEIIFRVLKNILRQRMRDAIRSKLSDVTIKDAIVVFLNQTSGKAKNSIVFWEKDVWEGMQIRFGEVSTAGQSKERLFRHVRPFITDLIRYTLKATGIVLQEECLAKSEPEEYPFIRKDIEYIGATVKQFHIIPSLLTTEYSTTHEHESESQPILSDQISISNRELSLRSSSGSLEERSYGTDSAIYADESRRKELEKAVYELQREKNALSNRNAEIAVQIQCQRLQKKENNNKKKTKEEIVIHELVRRAKVARKDVKLAENQLAVAEKKLISKQFDLQGTTEMLSNIEQDLNSTEDTIRLLGVTNECDMTAHKLLELQRKQREDHNKVQKKLLTEYKTIARGAEELNAKNELFKQKARLKQQHEEMKKVALKKSIRKRQENQLRRQNSCNIA